MLHFEPPGSSEARTGTSALHRPCAYNQSEAIYAAEFPHGRLGEKLPTVVRCSLAWLSTRRTTARLVRVTRYTTYLSWLLSRLLLFLVVRQVLILTNSGLHFVADADISGLIRRMRKQAY